MKFALPIAIVLILIGMIGFMFLSMGTVQQMTVVAEGNYSQQPLEMTLSHFQDSECGMVIDDLNYASQVAAPDGKTWFFHDHGGMAAWLRSKSFRAEAVIWVHDLDSGQWIDGRTAWYSRTDVTPMSYGFGAHGTKQPGYIDFPTMERYMLEGKTLLNPAVREELLGESWKQ